MMENPSDLEEAIMFDVLRRTDGALDKKVFLRDSYALVKNRFRKVDFEEFFSAVEGLIEMKFLREGKLYDTCTLYVYLAEDYSI